MSQLRWELARVIRAIGLPGWSGLVLLVACGVGAWLLIGGIDRDTAQLASDADALGLRLERQAARPAVAALSPQQQLAEFERRFAGEKSITASLKRLNEAARHHGVELAQAEFKFASEAREPLSRYTINLPIRCDYGALRRFTQEALHELPGLAMEEVSLRRADAKSTQLEAQLRFVLFVTRGD